VHIEDQLEEMRSYIASGDWDGLEKSARKRAEKLAGKDAAAAIAKVDLSQYTEQLGELMKDVFESAEEQEAAAVYFEYDMDNSWSGTFFVCQDYAPEEEEDDDWAADYDEEVEGPELGELAELYESGFDTNDTERGVNGYLIARTIAAFGRAVHEMPDSEFAVCIGFHDQDRVTRIREAEGRMLDSDDDEDEEDDDE